MADARIRFETPAGEVLYVRGEDGTWALPGGVIAKGETANQAARRHARALAIAVGDSIHLPEIEHDPDSETTVFLSFVDSQLLLPSGYAWVGGGAP